jgi:hypothetical protein
LLVRYRWYGRNTILRVEVNSHVTPQIYVLTAPPSLVFTRRYYAEKVRQKTYSLDESEVKPYFPLDRMCEAIFDCAYQLFGLKFKLRENIVSYHPDVQTYEVVFPLPCWLFWTSRRYDIPSLRGVWACVWNVALLMLCGNTL